jgi:flagellar protein FlaJ
MEKKSLILLLILNSILSTSIIIIDFLFLREIKVLFQTFIFFAIFVFILPIVLWKYLEYKRLKEIEDMFSVFLRDFVEAVRSGMPVTQAFKSVSNNDYRALTKYVKKITAQLDWGIPIDKVLTKFSKEVKSKVIARTVSSVIESHRFGGNLADTFEALSSTAVEVERLRAERRLYLHSQMITGYIVFFVFLGVIIGLEKFLVPSISQVSVPSVMGGAATAAPEAVAEEYKNIFRNLIIIQGSFAGLTVGKMAEGAMIAGIKHSLFMVFAGVVVFTLAA